MLPAGLPHDGVPYLGYTYWRSTLRHVGALCMGLLLALGCGGNEANEPRTGGERARAVGTTRYVDGAVGNDASAGTATRPWRTIAKAARSAEPGDTVLVRSGTYKEWIDVLVSGADGAWITFKPDAGAQVTIQGDTSFGGQPLLRIKQRHHVRFVGFAIRDYVDTRYIPYAIWIDKSQHVEIDGFKISNIRKNTASALPILVSSDDAANPAQDITVRRTEIWNCTTAPGQAITILGNVDGFLLESNYVHDVDWIALDMVGNYGTIIPATKPPGWTYDPVKDRPRNGLLNNNTVSNCGAIGIYADGAQDVIIQRSTVRGCKTGIQLAAEVHSNDGVGKVPSAATVQTSGITVRDNVVYDISNGTSDAFAFAVGAWTSLYGPVLDSVVTNNVFRSARGPVLINARTQGLVFANNIVSSTGTSGGLLSDRVGVAAGHRFSHNLYHAAAPSYLIGSKYYASLSAMAAGTGREAGSQERDPLFVNPAAGDYRTQAASPAVDLGDGTVIVPGQLDRLAVPRPAGAAVDVGGHER